MLSQRRGTRRPRTGFTTIELIVVIVIIGLAAAVSVPRIGPVVAKERARRGAQNVATMLEYAFASAGRTDKPIEVTYNTSTGVLRVADRASGNALRQLALKAGSEYKFQTVTFTPGSAVVVFPNGMSSSAITMTVGMSDFTKTITASRAGQVRVQ